MTVQALPHQRRLPPSARGRAQDASRDDLIIGAALDLLAERGYNSLTMTDVAARAGVSKATLYRRWTTKADLVADAVETLNPLGSPPYSGQSVRDDLLTLLEHAGNCDGRHEVVTATFEMARSHPDLYKTLSERFGTFVREELAMIAARSTDAGHARLSEVQLDTLAETVVALLAHHAGPARAPIPREHLGRLVDNVFLVLMTGSRGSV